MGLYNALDIIATITESFALYVMIGCFCKQPRFRPAVSRLLPAVSYGILVLLLTHFTDLGGIKIFIIFPFALVMTKMCYQSPLRYCLVTTELFYILGSILSEAVGISLMSWIYHGDTTTQVGGETVLKWQIYVATLLLRCVFLAIAYGLLRNFRYQIQTKDAAILTASFLLLLTFNFASTYNFLNLNIENTLLLDLTTSVLCVFFMVLFLYSKNVSYLREEEQRDKIQIAQLQQQFAYYQDKQRDEERVRAIYHDMKNHLLVLESKPNTDETRQMAQELRTQIADYEDYVRTGNEFLDIIMKDKAEKAREKHIDFSVAIDFKDIDFIEPLDISTLFGNGIDNAIEACEKLREEDRVILVKAGRVQNFISILIENNCVEEALTKGGRTTKVDTLLHGFGLSNMQKAAEKYGGTCTTRREAGTFTVKILLPVPGKRSGESTY